MNRILTAVATVVVATVASGGVLVGVAGSAAAASGPPFEPDASSVGGLTFYNSSGSAITSGSINDSPLAAFVQGNSVVRAGDNKATLFGYLPVNGQTPGQWQGEALGASTVYPNGSAPAPLKTATLPVESGVSGDETIGTLAADFPNTDTSADGYAGIYQLRLKTSSTSGGGVTTTYDSADIQVTGSTWSVVFSASAPSAPTTTTLSTTPGSPQNAGTPVTLNATVSPSTAAGTVQFTVDGTAIGSPVTVSAGAASTSTSSLPVGADSLGAVFTPAVPASFAGSSAAAVPFVINGVAAAETATALSVNPTSAPAFTAVTLTANVTKTSDSSAVDTSGGSVKFLDGASTLGTSPLNATGVATLSYGAFAAGLHNITAQFVPADATVLASSTSAVVPFTASAATTAAAPQSVDVVIPGGTLTITSPYSAANPFHLGSAVLDPGGAKFTASNAFGTPATPVVGNDGGVTVTDTRAGGQPWTASATVTDFTDGSSDVINGENLTFTGVTAEYYPNNALQSPDVVTNDVTNTAIYGPSDANSDGLKGGPHQFAKAINGSGTVNIDGVLTLTAPSSTPAGTYTATLTFTIA